MSCSRVNQSYSLPFNETLFIYYQNVLKVKVAYSYPKEGDLY